MTPKRPHIKPPQPVPEADVERDKQIADLRSLGWKLDDIGRAFGITKQRVSAILKRIARETKA